ncbi:hypothetical protein ACLI4U_03660 [Natrialbaceae archaeon A-CW2]|uniref:hypothetical protein n=1 Tax=Natronosalvus amylolyticus TaxID=2961994 RepID=UPI0020C941D7|nr:hypothetical protein [Natronosalvus amylolyticus]
MPDDEQHESETPLSERLVKGAVEKGMETPMRDPILEAVEEADETTPPAKRWIPAAGGLVSLGALAGYLAGRAKLFERTTEASVDIEADADVELESTPETAEETDETTDAEEGGRSLAKLLALGGGIVGAAVLWRRRQSADDEWEPIETFEPAVDAVDSSFEGEESRSGETETDADSPTEAEGVDPDDTTATGETANDEAETTPGGTDESS